MDKGKKFPFIIIICVAIGISVFVVYGNSSSLVIQDKPNFVVIMTDELDTVTMNQLLEIGADQTGWS